MKALDCVPLYEDAAFYDAEFAERAHEIPFYVERALRAGGPVLELACGTGRLTLPIAAAGVPIVGVDLVPSMIERARQKASAAGLMVDWHVADMRALGLGRTFRMAFIATNALQHLHDAASLEAFFLRAREHLEPGGTLIVDVFNPSVAKLARHIDQRRPHKAFVLPDGRSVAVDVGSEYLAELQLLHFELRYRVHEQLIRTKDVHMRCLFPEELLALCRAGGFEPVERFGDYDQSPFCADSPKQIVVCRNESGRSRPV
jgi:2-polyprenyl-3-methyl-5-hydroxy-6-metoxy-1,4-benzoquinol methylase